MKVRKNKHDGQKMHSPADGDNSMRNDALITRHMHRTTQLLPISCRTIHLLPSPTIRLVV